MSLTTLDLSRIIKPCSQPSTSSFFSHYAQRVVGANFCDLSEGYHLLQSLEYHLHQAKGRRLSTHDASIFSFLMKCNLLRLAEIEEDPRKWKQVLWALLFRKKTCRDLSLEMGLTLRI